MKTQMKTQINRQEVVRAWQKARELNPALAETAPEMNGAGAGFVVLLHRVNELEGQAQSPIDFTVPPSHADFEITCLRESTENMVVEITGVHSDTCEEETFTVPLRNPTPNVLKELRKLEGSVYPKPTRTLIEDFGSIGMRFATVTPFEALRFLAHNKMQRTLAMSAVERYSQAHKEGRWLPTNQGVGFDENGVLLDGQHRLFTCLLSGRPMEMLLVWGLKPEVREVVDNGIRRTPGQVDDLMHGASDDLPPGKIIEHFTAKIYLSHGGSTNKAGLYYTSIKNLYLSDLAWMNDYIKVKPRYPAAKKKMLDTATVVSAFLMLHKACPQETEAFAEAVFQRDNPEQNPAVSVLRDYLLVRHEKDDDYIDTTHKIFTAFTAYKTGKGLKELRGIGKKPSNAKVDADAPNHRWRRNRFYETLSQLWSYGQPLLPNDALKTIAWDPRGES